ncbi:MAG: hypothetical protein CVV27_03890 [Candidatus Melainabacteria bacterium HGW-Melainabacteria-1]|nr:MAG: hypothetical protein CVV27_03890 [Candidatus Melainabacteria bacterium HGW-Melainabacteria-1]
MLQGAWELAQSEQYSDAEEVDNFWTLAGYFNAIRELAGAQTLFRQDIPERLKRRAEELGQEARRLPADAMELSSRCNSTELPSMLEELSNSWEEQGMDAVMATSMFGTGVDVDRLGLMVVHGQPKTTAAYIQATGRVGRRRGALVVTFLRASRPRDLDHYEQFTGYHRALYRHVEPVTVAPFSPRAREKALGPALVSLLRQARSISWISVPEDWRIQQKLKSSEYRCEAARMKDHAEDAEIMACLKLFKERAEAQPEARRPDGEEVRREIAGEIDKWRMMASRLPESETMLWWEGSLLQVPRHTLVLGNQHTARHPHKEVFHNSPTSMRDVEATTTFEV